MIERHHSCRGLRFSKMSWARNPLASNSFPLKLLSDPPPAKSYCVNLLQKWWEQGRGSRQSSAHVPTPLKSTLAPQPASVANKRLTPRLSPLHATLTKIIGGGVAMVSQKSPREPVAHPFRGEDS